MAYTLNIYSYTLYYVQLCTQYYKYTHYQTSEHQSFSNFIQINNFTLYDKHYKRMTIDKNDTIRR